MLHVLVISLVEHPWNKIKSDYGCPKKRKYGMPKKHDPKKREKKGVTMSPKKKRQGMIREGKPLPQGVSHIHPSIHPLIHLHPLIEIAWLVSPWILSLTLQYMECKYALFLFYLELHKSFVVVGKTDGRYCHGEENTSWVPLESHPGNFAMFFKSLSKSISRRIADLWASKYYSMHHSNSQQSKTRRQLRSPMKE